MTSSSSNLEYAVLFDLDGTLIDSSHQITQAVSVTRRIMGFPHISATELLPKIGLPAKELFFDLNLNDEETDDAVMRFREALTNTPLAPEDAYKSANELLKLLSSRGYFIGVATNKPSQLARKALQETSLLEFCNVVVGAESLPAKPSPAILNECRRTTSFPEQNCLMIGDRVEDMLAAVSAGMRAIGLSQGVHTEDMLVNSGANPVFATINDLYSTIMNGHNIENL